MQITKMLRYHAAFALMLGFIVSGCAIETPEMPTFSTNLTVPLGTESVTVWDLIEDNEDLISVGDNSILGFSLDGDTTSLELEFDYGTEIEETELQTEVGVISIDGTPPIDFGFRADDLSDMLDMLPPGLEDIPPFTFTVDGDPTDIEGISNATIQTGEISLTLTNGLPVPISGIGEEQLIEVTLLDGDTMSPFATFIFDAEILPGESETKVADLAGEILPGNVAVILTGGSNGGHAPGGILPEHSLDIVLQLSDLVVTDAIAEVGAQEMVTSGSLALPDSLGLISAEIGQGDLAIDFDNGLAIPCDIEIAFDELFLANGSPLVVTLNLPAFQSGSSETSLENALIESLDGEVIPELNYQVTVVTPGSNGGIVRISSTDFINLSISPSRLTLESVTGILPMETWELDPVSEELDLPDDFEGFHLAGTSLVINIDNGTGVSGEIDFNITGHHADGRSTTVSHRGDIIAATDGIDGRTLIILDENNSNINELISDLPDLIEFGGDISVGGNGEVGTVRNGDKASVSWSISAPLSFSLDPSTTETDPELLDLDEETTDRLRENLIQSELLALIDNSFPFGVELNLFIGTDTTTVLESPEAVIGPISVAPGIIDSQTGWVTNPVTSSNTIIIDQTIIDLITSEGACSALFVTLPGTDGETVSVRADDGITFNGIISAEVLINDDLR